MRKDNVDYLEANYKHWATLRDAQYIVGLSNDARQVLLNIMREEFTATYQVNLAFTEDTIMLVRDLYTRYDEWKQKHLQARTIKITAGTQ